MFTHQTNIYISQSASCFTVLNSKHRKNSQVVTENDIININQAQVLHLSNQDAFTVFLGIRYLKAGICHTTEVRAQSELSGPETSQAHS